MRIIAGSHRGRRIAAPKGLATRPTSDRVRESAFNLIGPVDDADVIDLYAGSGALGLEALSRGAARVTFVESDRDACRVINANLDSLGFRGTVLCQDVPRALAQERGDYDLVLCDPPYDYDFGRVARLLAEARQAGRRARAREHEQGGRARAARARDPHLAPLRVGAAYPVRAVITAIYPGTYDPVTNGHVDVITRAARIFDRVVVGVVGNPQHKEPMFSVDERVDFVRQALDGVVDNVEVDVFRELVVDFARRWDAKVIVKGLRVVSDFEWEFQMNQLNRTLAPDIETVYVMASPAVSFVSSSGVKEIASFGGNVEELVPKAVAARLREMFPNGRGGAPVREQE